MEDKDPTEILEELIDLVKQHPNDIELGSEIRKKVNKLLESQ